MTTDPISESARTPSRDETRWPDFPWRDGAFARRAAALQLDETTDAGSRRASVRSRQIAQLVERLRLREPQAILDVGCGVGHYAAQLASKGHRVVGLDLSLAAVAHARRTSKLERSFVADLRSLPLRSVHFDVVLVLYGLLPSVAPREATTALRQIHSLLRPGGRVALELFFPQVPEALEERWSNDDESSVFADGSTLEMGRRRWFRDALEGCRWIWQDEVVVQTRRGPSERYVSRGCVYSLAEIQTLLSTAGFDATKVEEWNVAGDGSGESWVLAIGAKA